MNKQTPLLLCKDGLNKVIFYEDHIELGNLTISSHRYEEIKSFKFTNILVSKLLTIELWNGKKSNSSGVSNKDYIAAESLLKHSIEKTNKAFGEISGLSFRCTHLGGSEAGFDIGHLNIIIFDRDFLKIRSAKQQITIEISKIDEIAIEGPGTTTTNAGIIGGGFGVEGALQGMAAASLINSLTSKIETNTLIKISWTDGEIFLHHAEKTPEELRLALSDIFVKIKRSKQSSHDDDFISKIERLGALRTQGLITEEEYALGKSKLLSPP